MVSERIQRRVDALLDEADQAVTSQDWPRVAGAARAVLAIEDANEDALSFLKMAEANGVGRDQPASAEFGAATPAAPVATAPALPASFAAGRYAVRRFLGEGGKKRVYLAHDSRLDREVAFCSIRADGLDLIGHERVLREAQSVARLGGHPNLVPIYDIGEDAGVPFIVQEFMGGGDVAGLIEQSDDRRLLTARTLAIAKDVCRGLSFIHAGGMVHRDLKPANVFLSADGTAKVGDFGLAVSLDLSRLTVHGMMLGTVSYMPPEQALGGESTLKADLYSLGAMLYEMVTGRPPFLGDDPTAVISQHINTRPVAPSWATEHCPPPLEEVILHLLEKDPGQRPANAAEVLAALEKVDPEQRSASHSDSNVLDRLAKGVFVGREKELERLRKAFDEAFAGHGGLVMLVGEPGIGKTRTTQELETYARMRGATILWGRAHESSGAPPYWPWKQVGDSHARFVPPAELAGDLDPEQVAQLGRIFPTLRDNRQPAPITDPSSAQFLLFDAYSAFIRAGSERSPLLIVLDDLHWADKPSLLLLQHLARELGRMRVLVIGTFRDTDLSRTHPLSEALASLNREVGFQRVALRGLTQAEVGAYIRAAANVEPKPETVRRIFEETEGNPFFLSEVVNLLTQEGTLMKESVSDIVVPDGVREALGRRLDRISEEANELLQVCAVAGREFTYDTLTLLDERSEDQVLRLIEEAVEARVIEEMEQPGRYRFTHALMQETLLDELTTTRRVRLHGRVGEALEKRWGDRAAEERASRLAEHFVEAALLAPRFAEKAVHYSRLAASQAEATTAWDEAARQYERALAVLASRDTGTAGDEAALYTALGRCQQNAGNGRGAWRSLTRAIELYRERANGEGVATAAIVVAQGFTPPARQAAIIKDALATLGEGEPHLEARLLGYLIHRNLASQISEAEAEAARTRIEQLLSHSDFEDVRAQLLVAEGFRSLYAGDKELSAETFRRAHEHFARVGNVNEAVWATFWRSLAALFVGHLDSGLDIIANGRAYASKYRLAAVEAALIGYQAIVMSARCEVSPAQRLSDELEALPSEAVLPWINYRVVQVQVTGDHERAIALLPEASITRIPPLQLAYLFSTRAVVLWRAGRHSQAREAFARVQELVPLIPEAQTIDGVALHASVITILDEALFALADEEWIRRVERLNLITSPFNPTAGLSQGRVLARLHLESGRIDDAGQAYLDALEWCERERCPVEAGRCHQGLAEIGILRGDHAAALQHLDRAAELFRTHGARLFLDQVIAKKVELQGLTSEDMSSSIVALNRSVQTAHPDLSTHAAADGTVTLMFSDIEGSTALNEQMGDTKWMELLRAHNAVIDAQVKAHRGHVVKTMGDGYMVAFKSAEPGVRCALAIQRALSALRTQNSELASVRVRIGLHTGAMVRDGDDFFGREVNFAARVGAAAMGGQVLVSEAVRERLHAAAGLQLGPMRELPLKGFEGTHRVCVASAESREA